MPLISGGHFFREDCYFPGGGEGVSFGILRYIHRKPRGCDPYRSCNEKQDVDKSWKLAAYEEASHKRG